MAHRPLPPKLNADGSLRLDLGLSKPELRLPAWRSEYGLEVPGAAGFDYPKAVARMKKCCSASGYIRSPDNADIPARMTSEEAWFWLDALNHGIFKPLPEAGGSSGKIPTPQEMRRWLYGDLGSSAQRSLRMHSMRVASWYPELVPAVVTLLSPEEVVEFICRNCAAFERAALSQYCAGFGRFLAGCCMHFTPYLSREKTEALGAPFVDALRKDPDLTTTDGITAMAVLAVLGNTPLVTETLRKTKSKRHSYEHWLIARVASLADYEELARKSDLRFEGDLSAKIVLAASGVSRLDHLRMCLKGRKPDQQRVMKVLRRVLHPGIAPLMLELRSRFKEAASWLRENVVHAAVGLARPAAGADEHTHAARSFWQELWHDQPETARQALDWVPVETKPFLEKRLASAPGGRQPSSGSLPEELTETLRSLKSRPGPAWLALGALPALTVRGIPLTQPQIQALIQGWKASPEGGAPPWAPLLVRWADADSLHTFSGQLFEQWRNEGCPSADNWVLMVACLWGSEDLQLRLSRYLTYRPLYSPWPHSRACAGVRALAAAATPVAVSQLYRLAHATLESLQKTEARKMLEQAAASQHMSLEQFADVHVPTGGFDLAGRRAIESGGHAFEVRLNDRLELRFALPDGTESRRLPLLARELAPSDYRQLCLECRRVRRLLRDTWEVQILRARQAIAQDDHRPAEWFEQHVLRHPLLSRLARLFVWQVVPASGAPVAFRPAEDGLLLNAENLEITLPSGSRIHLASPATFSEKEVRGWIEHLADHQIVQPVQQFATMVCRPLPAERDLVKVNRFAGIEITGGQLKSVFAQEQWSHDKPQEDGCYTRHFRAFPAGQLFACVRHSRIWADEPNEGKASRDQSPATIEDVWFIPDHFPKKEWRNSKHYLAMRDVPPAIFSDVFSLLHRMTGVPVPVSTP